MADQRDDLAPRRSRRPDSRQRQLLMSHAGTERRTKGERTERDRRLRGMLIDDVKGETL